MPANRDAADLMRSRLQEIEGYRVKTRASPARPVVGKLIRRKTNKVDSNKCNILTFIKTIRPKAGRNWDDNDGLPPTYDTPLLWRHGWDDINDLDSTMNLTYNEYFDKLRFSNMETAIPKPSYVSLSLPNQHQLPMHLQNRASLSENARQPSLRRPMI
jgi:hypothetical protein